MHMEESRPHLRPPMQPGDWILELLALAVTAGGAAYLAARWASLPARLPTHFNLSGTPDGWGGRGTLLLVAGIGAALYLAMTLLEPFPWVYNYSIPITRRNAPRAYLLARRLIAVMKTEIGLLFAYINAASIRTAAGHANGIGGWFTAAMFLLLIGTTVGFTVLLHRIGPDGTS